MLDLFSYSPSLRTAPSPSPAATPETVSYGARLMRAARAMFAILSGHKPLTREDITRVMTEVMGGSDSEGRWTPREAYDCAEAALVLAMRRLGPAIRPLTRLPTQTLDTLASLEGLMPLQNRRTIEGELLQQFSTPPTLGWLAARALAVTEKDVVLEPSAGTGLLAVLAEAAGAKVMVNEICPTRKEILAAIFQSSYSVDALYLAAALPKEVMPTAVLMNPPFSRDAKRPDHRSSDIGLNHVAQAFERLAPGGRLVAILGENIDRQGRHEPWFKKFARSGALRADLSFDGNVYRRFGTTFGTRFIVLDKAAANQATAPVSGHFATVAAALPAVEQIPARSAATPSVPALAPAPRTQLALFQGAQPAAEPRRRAAAQQTAAIVPYKPSTEKPEPLHYDVVDWREPTGDLGEALYDAYRPGRLTVPGAKPHPDQLVQSAAMASIAPPAPTARPLLQPSLITDGRLSDAQLEPVIYAKQAHETFLEPAEISDDEIEQIKIRNQHVPELIDALNANRPIRRGFFIGDGTGVGKGSEVSGIILDNVNEGRKKHIWLSESDKLFQDAIRDWTWLRQDPTFLFSLGKIPATGTIERESGILFATYATLRGGAKDGSKTRLEQIIEWVGPDFDGVIAIDEAHNLGNAASEKGELGMTKAASQQGMAGVDLQTLLPNARVLYVSATGATELRNLAYAQRLGLWGPGTSFATREEFIAEMSAGGLAALELVSQDLKAMGLYVSRALSFHGVEYERLVHELTSDQVEIYNHLADAWALVLEHLDEALRAANIVSATGATLNGRAKAAALSQFWGTNQRFWNQVITAMKMPTILAAIEADLAGGHASVNQIANTNEAIMERALARAGMDDDLDNLDMTPRELLLDYVKTSFPTTQYVTYVDENGNERSKPLLDQETGDKLENPEAVRLREDLLTRLAMIKVPHGPLEMLIDHFGTEEVAEITGRKRRVITKVIDGESRRVVEPRAGSSNIADANAFMGDEKRILIFSPAGGTGRSYHADKRVKNQRRRYHNLIQAGWRSSTAVQGLGRSHRTNQACTPFFRLCTTNLKGELRFISTIARRLDQLGALTRGQRQTGNQGLFTETDNLESAYARSALIALLQDIHGGRIPDFSPSEFQKRTGLTILNEDGSLCKDLPPMSQFLNRVLSLRVDQQDRLFDLLTERMEALILQAHADGTYDLGIETIKPKTLEIEERKIIFTHPQTGANTTLLKLKATDPITPITFDQAVTRAEFYGDPVYAMNKTSGKVSVFTSAPHGTDPETGKVFERVRQIRPSGNGIMPRESLTAENWLTISQSSAQSLWNSELERMPKDAVWSLNVIAGTLLPIWAALPRENVRIYRMQTDAGERILGRVIKAHELPKILTRLGHSADEVMNPEAILDYLTGGSRVKLANGWTIKMSRYNNQQRIEIIIPDANPLAKLPTLQDMGVLIERIDYRTRFFLPMDTPIRYLERLLKLAPADTVQNARAAA